MTPSVFLVLTTFALAIAHRGGGGHGGVGYGFSAILPAISTFNGNLTALNTTLYASSPTTTTASLLPCLSATNAASVRSCDDQETAIRINNVLSYYNGSAVSINSFCKSQCILQQFNALNSTGSLNQTALEAVIRNTNLTDAQKTTAIATMATCISTSGVTVASTTNNCFPGVNNYGYGFGHFGGRFKRRAHGGRPSGSHESHGGGAYLGMQTTSPICRTSVTGLTCLGNALSSQGCGTCAAAFYNSGGFSNFG